MYTVGELSSLAGVSVRALHHYDEIGRPAPGARAGAVPHDAVLVNTGGQSPIAT